jgi:uncharacterized protein (TIGR02646 family)
VIRIDRSRTAAPPALLAAEPAGLDRLREILRQRRLKSADFDREIFASDEAKLALWEMQHAKCCYCEGLYERSYSDVEHFRPKVLYWWLAYRFDNLYFSCSSCNRPKKDHFPLQPGTQSLAAEQDPRISAESPLLLDPGFDDVAAHLTFEWLPTGYQIAPFNGSERGRWTIQILGLDRDDLTKLRRSHYRRELVPLIDRFHRAQASGDAAAQEEILREAEAHSQPDAPFSLLARVTFQDAGILAEPA